MARFMRLEVYDTVLSNGLVPIFYHGDPGISQSIVNACVDGGTRVMEFTNRGDHALKVFASLSETLETQNPGVILGVGSIVDAPTAALFIAHGANFVVSPTFNPEVAKLCNRRKIAYMPGCATATEISNAEEMGAEIVKLFPGGTVGGPAFLKALLGPMPWSRIMPTSGVEPTREDIAGWFKAGAACLGIGGNLIRKDWVAAGNFAAIRDTVGNVMQWITEVRGK